MAYPRLHLFSSLLLACAGAAGAAGALHGRIVVEDFESFAWGEDWAAAQFAQGTGPPASLGPGPPMRPERDLVHSGHQACRLDVPAGATLTLARLGGKGPGSFSDTAPGPLSPAPLPGAPARVGLWVHGEGGGQTLWLRTLDAAHRTHDVALGTVDFDGWKLLEGSVGSAAPPLGLSALVVRGGDGPLVVDDLTVTTTADAALWVDLRPVTPGAELVEGDAAEFRVRVQSLAREATELEGELAAYETAMPTVAAARERFSVRVSAAEPFARVARLRLAAGVYTLAAAVGDARCERRVVVYPREARKRGSVSPAIRRFRESGDTVRVIESAFTPALLVEAGGHTLTLFRGLGDAGLSAPQCLLARTEPEGPELAEPWLLAWFGSAPEWKQVAFADGSPCPTFDVPFLVVLDRVPRAWRLENGLELKFARRGARVGVMPLFGIRKMNPADTTRWLDVPETVTEVSRLCTAWVPLLRALPIDVTEEWRVDAERDAIEARVSFQYLETHTSWGGAPRRVAPVAPLLMLARQAGLAVRFSREPVSTGCFTSVGPYWVVPDTDSYTYSVSGLLRFVLTAVADVPAGVPGARVSFARTGRALSDDAAKIPFWAAGGGPAGKLASDALLRYMLSRQNARHHCDAARGRMHAWDGLAAQTQGDGAAAAAADHLQGCWYGGLHAGLWDTLRASWRHILALREPLASEGGWATLGLGAGELPSDTRLNAEIYFARLAARLSGADEFTEGCARAVKLMVAAHALVAAAPAYTEQLGPWGGLGTGRDRVIGRCASGSLGFATGPAPFVTCPSDAGYSFAAEFLGGYYRERFRGGPLEFFGRGPAEWSQRLFVTLAAPDVGIRFRPAPAPSGPYATNYVFTVETGPEGWPALAWRSHRAPSGGPLILGGVGGEFTARGRLDRRTTVSPSLRLSAYTAIAAPRPPTELAPPPPPGREEPSAGEAADTPGRSRP